MPDKPWSTGLVLLYWLRTFLNAGMAELADAADSKSAEVHPSWGFDPPSRHHLNATSFGPHLVDIKKVQNSLLRPTGSSANQSFCVDRRCAARVRLRIAARRRRSNRDRGALP